MRASQLLAPLALALSVAALSSAEAAAEEAVARVERTERLPKRLENIGVSEQLDNALPLDLSFTDDAGKPVVLRDYFDRELPVIVTLNYSDCPMLCSLELNALVDALKEIDFVPGKHFQIVTIGLDPDETPQSASKTKTRYLRDYGRPEAAKGWHFLTGTETNVRAVAGALGFRYAYNEKRDEYVHPAAIMFITPGGRVARYLYGIEYEPQTLRLSLVETSEGKIGSTMDRILLYCFHFDSSEGRYAPLARNVMRAGGGAAALCLAGFLAVLFRTDRKRRRLAAAGAESSPS